MSEIKLKPANYKPSVFIPKDIFKMSKSEIKEAAAQAVKTHATPEKAALFLRCINPIKEACSEMEKEIRKYIISPQDFEDGSKVFKKEIKSRGYDHLIDLNDPELNEIETELLELKGREKELKELQKARAEYLEKSKGIERPKSITFALKY